MPNEPMEPKAGPPVMGAAYARKCAKGKFGLLRAAMENIEVAQAEIEKHEPHCPLADPSNRGRVGARCICDPRDSGREYIAEGKRQAEPSVVETVQEALGRLLAAPDPCPMAIKKAGAWAPSDATDEDDVNAATILNSLPALLDLAKRPSLADVQDVLNRWENRYDTGYRKGVIKGLETMRSWARNNSSREARQWVSRGFVNALDEVIKVADGEIARIRSTPTWGKP